MANSFSSSVSLKDAMFSLELTFLSKFAVVIVGDEVFVSIAEILSSKMLVKTNEIKATLESILGLECFVKMQFMY